MTIYSATTVPMCLFMEDCNEVGDWPKDSYKKGHRDRRDGEQQIGKLWMPIQSGSTAVQGRLRRR